jgi:cytidyltransferase-like protein
MKVMVFGTFDILHKGHLNFFKQAGKYGDYLIAVIARDKTVKQVKGILPHHKEKIRLNQVKKHVDKAVLGMIKNKYKVIEKYKPDIICLGYDQKEFINGLKKYKIPVKKLKPYKPHIHKSSKLRKKLKKQ